MPISFALIGFEVCKNDKRVIEGAAELLKGKRGDVAILLKLGESRLECAMIVVLEAMTSEKVGLHLPAAISIADWIKAPVTDRVVVVHTEGAEVEERLEVLDVEIVALESNS